MVFIGIKDYTLQWNISLLSGGDRMEEAKTGRERSNSTLKLTKQYCPKGKTQLDKDTLTSTFSET